MDVNESEWISKAITNIDRYLNRGGDLKGDEPQLLGGTNLLNTIGVAMFLPVRDPKKWSNDELRRAINGELVYYEGDARKAIDVVANQIRRCCGGDDKNFVTVLPIEIYYKGKLYELPLFRVQRYKDSTMYYIDNTGRSYDSDEDWFVFNMLPPCKMAYPRNLKLQLRPGYNYSWVLVDDSPPARVGCKVAKGVDVAASVTGIGASVGLLFATGGLATPFVAAGICTAVWGTGRTAFRLTDKALHGQNINPFKSSENTLLWLGIAANLVSFGAMGATTLLTSLAARGLNISTTFKLIVDIMNGTNIVVSGVAMLSTTVFLIGHYEQMSSVDVLMHIASMAFWTKGVFSYKSAGTLIKNVQDHTFQVISNELPLDDAKNLSLIRTKFNNDALLIREFHRASEANISIQTFSQIIIDSSFINGNIVFDGKGNLVLAGGQTYSFKFLSSLPQKARRHYFDVITNLEADQIKLLENFRQTLNNDMNLIIGLDNVAFKYQLTPREATERVLTFWKQYTEMNLPGRPDMSMSEGGLVVGRAPPMQLKQLKDLSTPMMRFVGEHLVHMDESTSQHWTTSFSILQQLESQGMFSKCTVTKIVPTGRAVILLNENLQISIYKLKDMDSQDCINILKVIGQLPPKVASSAIPEDTQILLNKYKLRLECDRSESVDWITKKANGYLPTILNSKLESFEKDRLFTFKTTIQTSKAEPYMTKMMKFISDMNPKNVSEMVSYGEYVVTYVEAEKRNLDGDIRSGILKVPAHTKKAEFLRQKASEAVFANPEAMRQKWVTTIKLVRENSMVGPVSLNSGLSDAALVQAIRGVHIGFGSEASAAYHVLKHPTDPLSAYVQRANETIRTSGDRWNLVLAQDGDARLIRFESPGGAAIVLERNGRVLLCTFSPKVSRR